MEYFKHDINASEDDKICDLLADGGYELLGYYWRFIEYLYGRGGKVSKDRLNAVAWSLHMDADKLSRVICNYGLFVEDDEIIYSPRVVEEVEGFQSVGKRMAEIGKAGGKASAKAKSERAVEENQADAQPCAQQKRINKKEKIKENKREDTRVRATPSKHPCGKFQNVLLTEEQERDLCQRFPNDYDAKIDRLSEYMHQTGKTYKDHYEIILKWAKEDGEKQSSFNLDEFVKLSIEKSALE